MSTARRSIEDKIPRARGEKKQARRFAPSLCARMRFEPVRSTRRYAGDV